MAGARSALARTDVDTAEALLRQCKAGAGLCPEALALVPLLPMARKHAVLLEGAKFSAGDSVMGLKEGGVTFAEVTLDFPGKAEALAKVKSLEAAIIAGSIVVPANEKDLEGFVAPAN